MKVTWPSIRQWARERKPLILAWAVVSGALVLGLYHACRKPEEWATVFILGVTALVAAWYADETRRMADGTRALAESERKIALETSYCELELREGVSPSHRDLLPLVLRSKGPGTAWDVRIIGPEDAGELCQRDSLVRDDEWRFEVRREHEEVTVTWLPDRDDANTREEASWRNIGGGEWRGIRRARGSATVDG